jgi:hypothetical protein
MIPSYVLVIIIRLHNITLEESLSITTGRCDLAIASHARKMHKKNINMIVNYSILVSHYPKPLGGQPQRDFYAFS